MGVNQWNKIRDTKEAVSSGVGSCEKVSGIKLLIGFSLELLQKIYSNT
jgi:hypothetical protein